MRSNFAYDTEALWQQDRDHIIHPWIDLGSAKTREPLIVAAAEGVHIYDSRGHRMIDGIGGMWCVNIGYGREEMAQAIADQVRRMPYFSPFGLISTPESIEFGKRSGVQTISEAPEAFETGPRPCRHFFWIFQASRDMFVFLARLHREHEFHALDL